MFAYYFPPLGGGGVQRTLKYLKYLPAVPELLPILSAPTGGRPGDRIAGRPARSDLRIRVLTATPLKRALRRALESAQYTSDDYAQTLDDYDVARSLGSTEVEVGSVRASV